MTKLLWAVPLLLISLMLAVWGAEGQYTVVPSSVTTLCGNAPCVWGQLYYEVWYNYPKAIVSNYMTKEIADDEAEALNEAHERRMDQDAYKKRMQDLSDDDGAWCSKMKSCVWDGRLCVCLNDTNNKP